MLEHQPSQQIKRPTKQHIVNWIEEANSKLNSNACIVKKAFQVTGLSNALGGGGGGGGMKKMLMVALFLAILKTVVLLKMKSPLIKVTAQFQMTILVLYVDPTMSLFLTDVLTALAIDI